jgi:hypothetical protein
MNWPMRVETSGMTAEAHRQGRPIESVRVLATGGGPLSAVIIHPSLMPKCECGQIEALVRVASDSRWTVS